MTRFGIIIGACATALGAFWIALKNFAHSQKDLGAATVTMEQQAEILDDVESAKRIQDQLEKDRATLTPDELRQRVRDKWIRQ